MNNNSVHSSNLGLQITFTSFKFDSSFKRPLMKHTSRFILFKVHLRLFFFSLNYGSLCFCSNLPKKVIDSVKFSNFYAPSKPSFGWFATAHGETRESKGCDVKSRTNATAVPVRSSKSHECRRHFAMQFSRWDSTVYRFLFLRTMASNSSDSEMSFDSEDSDIYYIAEVETEENDESRLSISQT